MGGIAAIFDFTGRPADPVAIRRMTAAMEYRGPDGFAHWTGEGAALGACHMHTTAESRMAVQPWGNEDRSLLLLFDGFLAFPEDLRRELEGRGTRLRNDSDCELVLRAFEAWGDDCASHLDGEFAFVIWDDRHKRVHCARDHIGLRPLFYMRENGRLILASDLCAIRAASGSELTPNLEVLVQLAAGQYYFRSETIWTQVRRVMPAHAVCFSQSGKREHRYWRLPEPYSIRLRSDAEYAEHYRHVLTQSVIQCSRSDRPVGIEVSGGLDSSAVFAVTDRLANNGQLRAPGFTGFALKGPRGSSADEIGFTQAVEHHVGRSIHRCPLNIPPFDWFLSQSQRDADMPYFPNSAMTMGMYKSMAGQGHRIALNGLGGDEWLNGNTSLFLESLRHHDWPLLHRSFAAVSSTYGTAKAMRAMWRFGLRPWLANPWRKVMARGRTEGSGGRIHAPPWLSAEGIRKLQDSADRHDAEQADSTGGRQSLKPCPLPMTMAILEQASRLRSQCGIEGRHPLFSRRFIEFSAGTPEAIRLRGNQQKFIHRLALGDMLPGEVLARSTKAEFSPVFVAQVAESEQYLRIQSVERGNQLLDTKGLEELFTRAKTDQIDSVWAWPLWGSVALASIVSAST